MVTMEFSRTRNCLCGRKVARFRKEEVIDDLKVGWYQCIDKTCYYHKNKFPVFQCPECRFENLEVDVLTGTGDGKFEYECSEDHRFEKQYQGF